MPDPFGGRLSFVAPANMWAVTETGDWTVDTRTGAKYASELTAFMEEDPCRVPMLGHVIRDMVQRGKFGAIEIGFCHHLSAILATRRGCSVSQPRE